MKRVVLAMLTAATAAAAKGTLELEVTTAAGVRCSADVEVRKKGAAAVIKTFVALGGTGSASLEPGEYDVTAKAKAGADAGTLRVTIASGQTARHRVEVKPPAAAPAPAQTAAPPPGKPLHGTVLRAGGEALEGTVVVWRQAGSADVEKGHFQVKDLAPGAYVVEFRDRKGKKMATKTVEVGNAAATITIEVP